MIKRRECLIGRYEAAHVNDCVEIYDTQDVHTDGDGKEIPLKVIHYGDKSPRQCCLLAIAWLRDDGKIDQTD